MYRRNKRGPGCLILVVILGILAGAFYVVRDQMPPDSANRVVLLPTSTPVVRPTATAVYSPPTPTAASAISVLLVIPNAQVAAPVIQVFLGDGDTWDVRHLGYNAGHLNGTAWYDQPGNMVIAGHVEMSDGKPGIFAHIDQLKINDEVLLITAEQTRIYRVNGIQDVAPDDLRVLYPTPNDRLTLLTCGDYDLISNTYFKRIVVTTTRTT